MAVLRRSKLQQLGLHVPPNRCTFIQYTAAFLLISPYVHHKNVNASRSFSATRTWWNIASMSPVSATSSCLNRRSTPSSEFVMSGPCRTWSLSDTSWYFAAQSNTTLSLPGFLGCYTGWWGRYCFLFFNGHLNLLVYQCVTFL